MQAPGLDSVSNEHRKSHGPDSGHPLRSALFSGMFKKFSQAALNQSERKYWADAKARGRPRFILREATGSTLIWLIVLPAVQVLGHHENVFSRQFVMIWLIMLPIFLLGGYLTAGWRWKDFEKKYPE